MVTLRVEDDVKWKHLMNKTCGEFREERSRLTIQPNPSSYATYGPVLLEDKYLITGLRESVMGLSPTLTIFDGFGQATTLGPH